MFSTRRVTFVLGVAVTLTNAAILKEFKLTSYTDEWSGDKSQWVMVSVGALNASETQQVIFTVAKASTQVSGSQGIASITLQSTDCPALLGKMEMKVTYADSSRVIDQTTNSDGVTGDISIAYKQVDPSGNGYLYQGGYFFLTGDQILKNATKLVVRITWQEPYRTSTAFAGTGNFAFSASDLKEVRRVLNYDFMKE